MRVVCFDVGGVLLEINYKWSGAIADVGLPPELAARFDFLLTDLEHFNAYQKGELSDESYLSELAGFLGVSIEDAKKVHNAILRSTYAGIPELIAELHQKGIRTGCLSNTNAPHWDAFFYEPRLAVLKEIHHPLASHLIGAEKPDVRMYLAFEEACGASPDEIVYFDDGEVNVEAARTIGWNAFVVDPAGDTATQMRTKLQGLGWL